MDIQVMPELIDQFRETFEGGFESHRPWITDGGADDGVFGTIASLSPREAFAKATPNGRSAAGHVKHLHYALDLLHQRMLGSDPKADWKNSFNLDGESPELWEKQQRQLREVYEKVLAVFQQQRGTPPEKMPPVHLVGISATTAHNAYHLGALRQIVKTVKK